MKLVPFVPKEEIEPLQNTTDPPDASLGKVYYNHLKSAFSNERKACNPPRCFSRDKFKDYFEAFKSLIV